MLDQIHIDPGIFDAFPSYLASVVCIEAIPRDREGERPTIGLGDAEASARAQLPSGRPADHPHVAAWREAYSRFGSKPSKYPCSVEALLKRVFDGGLPSINQLVDLYNAVSLEHILPVGGEDHDRLSGELVLRFAKGDECFDGEQDHFGAPVTVRQGEPVWVDDIGVTCRRWNWRQGRRTALTENTRNAFFVLDALAPYTAQQLDAATELLVDSLVAEFDGCRIQTKRFGQA